MFIWVVYWFSYSLYGLFTYNKWFMLFCKNVMLNFIFHRSSGIHMHVVSTQQEPQKLHQNNRPVESERKRLKSFFLHFYQLKSTTSNANANIMVKMTKSGKTSLWSWLIRFFQCLSCDVVMLRNKTTKQLPCF